MMWRIRVMVRCMAGWMDGWVWLVGMLEGWMFRMYVRVTRCLRLLQETVVVEGAESSASVFPTRVTS
jgi:hypothetical protein